jgi:hypothetical protein
VRQQGLSKSRRGTDAATCHQDKHTIELKSGISKKNGSTDFILIQNDDDERPQQEENQDPKHSANVGRRSSQNINRTTRTTWPSYGRGASIA